MILNPNKQKKCQKIKVTLFDLDLTLKSGQVFGWKNRNGWWIGEINGKPLQIKQQKNTLIWNSFEKEVKIKEIRKYFSLDVNIVKIQKKISTDETIKKIINEFKGLRLIRQEPWYCMIGFVCSSFSNIPRIEKNIEQIKKMHGKKINEELFLFPTIEELKTTNTTKLRACGLGFRDKYVHQIANKITYEKLDKIKRKDYPTAKKELMKLPGIGEKIADCILLFSFEKGESFPIDVWISRAMKKLYGNEIKKMIPNTKYSYRDIQSFAMKKWENNAGYAQQLIYMYARKHRIK